MPRIYSFLPLKSESAPCGLAQSRQIVFEILPHRSTFLPLITLPQPLKMACTVLSLSQPLWTAPLGEVGFLPFPAPFGPEKISSFVSFLACLFSLLSLVSVCAFPPPVCDSEALVAVGVNSASLLFSVDTRMSQFMNDTKNKLSATVCFILGTQWHHHVVTSLHARACSFLLFGL